MQLRDVLASSSAHAGKFLHSGLPVNLRLGDARTGLAPEFTGSVHCLAGVFGLIEIPTAFLFAGAETVITVNAVIGHPGSAQEDEVAIRFATVRPGSVGGRITLEVNAMLLAFEYLDRTDPGGLGKKTVAIEGRCGRVRVVTEGSANKGTFRLSISGDRAEISIMDGPALKVTTEMQDGWLVCFVRNEA